MGKVLKTREELKGITWDEYKRERYAGEKITAENRNKKMKEKFIELLEKSEVYNSEDSTEEEKALERSIIYQRAKDFVNREKKHERAYLKGKNSYMFKGQKYFVLTDERIKRYKENFQKIEEQYKNGEIDFFEEE